MTTVYKKGFLYTLIIAAGILLTGCSSQKYDYSEMEETYNCIDSVVDYSIKAPLSTEQNQHEIFFSVPFYRVYADGEDMDLSQDTFEIGEEAKLTGENVDLLDGAAITLYETKLSNCIDYDYYCQRMAYFYMNAELNQETEQEIDTDTLEAVKDIVSHTEEDYTVITINMSFSGCIYDDITIESLTVEPLNFSFDFDNFSISTVDVADGIPENEDETVIDYTTGTDGLFADAKVPDIGYWEIIGEVKNDIANIEVTSLDDDITVVTAENYKTYQELENVYGVLYEDIPTSYDKGDTISATYSYVRNTPADNADAKIVNLFVTYTLKDGTTINKFVYQPAVVDGPYLMMKMISEYIE